MKKMFEPTCPLVEEAFENQRQRELQESLQLENTYSDDDSEVSITDILEAVDDFIAQDYLDDTPAAVDEPILISSTNEQLGSGDETLLDFCNLYDLSTMANETAAEDYQTHVEPPTKRNFFSIESVDEVRPSKKRRSHNVSIYIKASSTHEKLDSGVEFCNHDDMFTMMANETAEDYCAEPPAKHSFVSLDLIDEIKATARPYKKRKVPKASKYTKEPKMSRARLIRRPQLVHQSDTNMDETVPYDGFAQSPASGLMEIRFTKEKCLGFQQISSGTYAITYDIRGGETKDGHAFEGSILRAFIPDCDAGYSLLKRLKWAWKEGLTFDIESSKVVLRVTSLVTSSGRPRYFFADCNDELDTLLVPPGFCFRSRHS